MTKRATLPFPIPPGTDEDLLTPQEAARRLGIKPDTLKRLAQQRQIASIKYGKLRRFEPSVVREYIAKHRVG